MWSILNQVITWSGWAWTYQNQNEYDRSQVWLSWNQPSSVTHSATHSNLRFSWSFTEGLFSFVEGRSVQVYEWLHRISPHSWGQKELRAHALPMVRKGSWVWEKRLEFECRLSIYVHISWTKLLITMNSNCFNWTMKIMTTAYFTRLLESSSLVMIVKVLHKMQIYIYTHIFGIICVIILSSLLRCWWAYLMCTRTTWKTC